MSDDKGAPEDPPTGRERRHNLELRERLDQILDLARQLYREASQMSRDELEEARERVEWLAQEIWEAAVYGPLEERSRPTADDTGEGESGG
jgi:Lon protease-like protein